jgi:hypothetical protein
MATKTVFDLQVQIPVAAGIISRALTFLLQCRRSDEGDTGTP